MKVGLAGGAPKKRVPETKGVVAKSGKENPAKREWLEMCELIDNGSEEGWDLEEADRLGKQMTSCHGYCKDEMTVSEIERHNEAVLEVNEALTGNAVEYIEWYIKESDFAAGQLAELPTAEDESQEEWLKATMAMCNRWIELCNTYLSNVELSIKIVQNAIKAERERRGVAEHIAVSSRIPSASR